MDPTTAEPPTGPKPPEAAAKAKRASSSKDAKPKKEKSKDKEKGESKAKDKSKDKTKDKTKSSKSRRGSSSSTGAPADEAATATAPRREKPPAGEATAAATAGAVAMAPAPAPGLTRTLSFHGGLAVAEALHAELATGVRLLVQDEEDPNGGLTLQAPGVISREERGSPRSPLGGSGKLPRPTVMGDACHATLSLYPVLTGAGSNQQRCGFLEAVVDAGPTRRLEKAGAVNWHADCPYLVALKTESDGNCLCHAAALGTWGVHDRKLLLRHAVRSLLVDGRQRAVRLLRRAWERELGRHGVKLAKEDLDLEWATLARQAEETAPAGGGAMDGGNGGYAYLEAAHVYALAHVLRRPIVVLATDWVNAQGKTLARAEEIAGIYLPYALPRRFLTRTPLLLAFDSFHFSPLVPMDPSKPARIPLVQGPAAATAKSGGSTPNALLPLPFFSPCDDSSSSSSKPPTREEALAVLQAYLDCETLPDGTLVARIDPDPTAPEGLAAVLLQNAIATVAGVPSGSGSGMPPRRHSSASLGAPSRSSSSSSLASWLTPIGPAKHPPAPRDTGVGSSGSSVGSASTVGSGGSGGKGTGSLNGSLYKTSGNASASSYTPPRNLHSLNALRRQQTPAEQAANAAAIAAWSSGIRRRDGGSGSRRRSRPEGSAEAEEAARVSSMAKSASWCCPPGMAPLPRARKISVERTASVGDLSGSGAAAMATTADPTAATAGAATAGAAAAATPDAVLAHAYEDDTCTGAGRAREDVFTALARAVREAAAQSKQAALETSTSLSKKAAEAGTALKNPRALLAVPMAAAAGGGVAGITAGMKGLWAGAGGKGAKGAGGAAPVGVEEMKGEEPAPAPVPAQGQAVEGAEEAKKQKKERKEKDRGEGKEKEKRSKDKGKDKDKDKLGSKKEKKAKREKPQEAGAETAAEAATAVSAEQQEQEQQQQQPASTVEPAAAATIEA